MSVAHGLTYCQHTKYLCLPLHNFAAARAKLLIRLESARDWTRIWVLCVEFGRPRRCWVTGTRAGAETSDRHCT